MVSDPLSEGLITLRRVLSIGIAHPLEILNSRKMYPCYHDVVVTWPSWPPKIWYKRRTNLHLHYRLTKIGIDNVMYLIPSRWGSLNTAHKGEVIESNAGLCPIPVPGHYKEWVTITRLVGIN